MSFAKLHRRKERKLDADEERQVRRHEAACDFVAAHEEALLRKVFAAFHFAGTPFDARKAANIVANFDTSSGFSFHEALYCLCFVLDKEGNYPAGFTWRVALMWSNYLPEVKGDGSKRRNDERARHDHEEAQERA